jgi:hypothetical protein
MAASSCSLATLLQAGLAGAAPVVIMAEAFGRGILAWMGWLSVAVPPGAAAASGIPTGTALREIVVTATWIGLVGEARAASEGVVLATQLKGRPCCVRARFRRSSPARSSQGVRSRPRAQCDRAGARHQELRPRQRLERRQSGLNFEPHSMNRSHSMRISIFVAAIASTFVMVQPALGQTSNTATTSSPGKVGVAQTVEASATIVAIDKATRDITLKGPKGDEVRITAGPEVRNFDQLKVGDVVKIKYLESLAIELKKGGGLKVQKTEAAGAAGVKPGEQPAGVVGRQVTVVGDVIKLDAATQTITVKGPERTVDLKARDPEQFKLIAVGDQIQATYTEALAVAVTPVAKPAETATK